jgi:hypothetical protein
MGWIASSWGVPLSLMVGAILSLIVGLAAWPWLARIRRDQRAVASEPGRRRRDGDGRRGHRSSTDGRPPPLSRSRADATPDAP